jgi:NAD(P)-dependent dehydrogenase (short-subunit alcohol dehydrogenase family)
MELTEKTAVITGAASGFGREFALACAQRGMRLVLADLDADGLEQTAALLRPLGAPTITQTCNVSRGDEVARLADRAWEAFGAVHLLFNNAGVAAAGPVWLSTPEDWKWVLDVNLMGVVHGLQSFVPRMIAQGGEAHVVNTASIAGLISPPGLAVYAASKHAVVALSECLHHDLRLAGTRIGVSVLCPGFVKTGIAQSHRHRPPELANSNPQARAHAEAVAQAMQCSPVSAADVAQVTLDAVRDNRFYILTHPETETGIRFRMDSIIGQSDPHRPGIG